MDPMTNLFWMEGLTIMKHKSQNSTMIGYRKYKTFFGVSPNVCGVVWKLLKEKPQGSQPKHLLWSLLLLKTYNKEHVNASLAGADEKTFREWSWKFVKMLSDLRVVKLGNRFKNAKYRNTFVTLDGTDFRIQEPRPFNKKWYSHKFKAAGARYEIGLSIGTADIVWASGGFKGKGYEYQNFFKKLSNAFEKKLLARHENVNGGLKQFEILNARFRHPLKKHPTVFHACVNLIQVSINCGEKMYEI